MGNAINSMKRFVAKLGTVHADGKGIDQAVRSASNGKFWSYKSLMSSFLADWKKSVVTNHWSVEKFVSIYCGMNFSNKDTGSLIGLDAGGKVEKTKASVIPTMLSVDKWKLPASQKTTIDGCTFIWPNMKNLTNKEKYLLKGLHSSWIKGALQVIKQSFGISFGAGNSSCNTITVKFVKDNPTRSAWVSTSWIGEKVTKLTLHINTNVDFDMKSADGVVKGNWVGDNRMDRNLAHELTHACLSANILGGYDLPLALNEGIAELVHGGDDTRKDYITSILSKSNIDKFKKTMALDSHNFWVEGLYGGSIALLRYMIKQGLADSYRYTNAKKTAMALTSVFKGTYIMSSWKKVVNVDARENKQVITIKGTSANNVIYANKKTSTVSALAGNDTIVVSGGTAHKLSAGTGNDKFTVSAGTKSFLYGESGSDTFVITGGSQNRYYGNVGADTFTIKKGTSNSLYGQEGSDTINITGGSSNVAQGGLGNDVIVISNGNNNKAYGNDGNDILTIKGGTDGFLYGNIGDDRLYVTAGTNNRMYGHEGKDKLYIQGGTQSVASGMAGDDTIIISAGTKGLAYGGDGIDTFSLSKGTEFKIFGNVGDDIITVTGGSGNQYYGGDGNDTFRIKGGTNDKYYAGNGNDKFEIDSSLFKGTSVISLVDTDIASVNTFIFNGAVSDYVFSMIDENLSVVGLDEKIDIIDWNKHTNSRMVFSGGVSCSVSDIKDRVVV